MSSEKRASSASNAALAAPSSKLAGRRPVRERGRFGGREPFGEVLLHRLDATQVVQRVEAQTAGRAGGLQQRVAPLPGAKELGAHARAATQLTDPQLSGPGHHPTIQHLYKSLTRRSAGATVGGQYLYRRCTAMKKLDVAAATLVLVGGLNWGLVGLAKFDLVAWIFGGMSFGETNAASRIVYGLVGLAAVYGFGRGRL